MIRIASNKRYTQQGYPKRKTFLHQMIYNSELQQGKIITNNWLLPQHKMLFNHWERVLMISLKLEVFHLNSSKKVRSSSLCLKVGGPTTLLILPPRDIKNPCNMVTRLEAKGEMRTAVWRRKKNSTKRSMKGTMSTLPRATVSHRLLNLSNLSEVAKIWLRSSIRLAL